VSGFQLLDKELNVLGDDFFRVYFRDIELGELDVSELRFRSVRTMP
jgi:hypothetical protein